MTPEWATAALAAHERATPSWAGRSGTSSRARTRLGRVLLRVQRVHGAAARGRGDLAHRHERRVRPAGDRRDGRPSARRACGRGGSTHDCASAGSVSTALRTWCSSTTRTSAWASSSRSGGTTRARTRACATRSSDGDATSTPWLAALPPVLYWRMARNVFSRGRRRRSSCVATPLILLYVCVWAAGEAVGYAFGGGRSLLKVRDEGRCRRDELGQPPRLRPLRAQRRGAARRWRGRRVRALHRRADRTGGRAAAGSGRYALWRSASPPAADAPRSLRDLGRVSRAARASRSTCSCSRPSTRGSRFCGHQPSSASTTSSPSNTPS